jgi:hypothetical protein
MNFGLSGKTKLEILEEVFMTLSYAAIANNDKI